MEYRADIMERNYLRVRGEYPSRIRKHSPRAELPPRTRRIHYGGLAKIKIDGTTSAYAENTLNELGLL